MTTTCTCISQRNTEVKSSFYSLCVTNNYVGGSRDANKINFFLETRETRVFLFDRLEADWISLKFVYSILHKLLERFYHVAC